MLITTNSTGRQGCGVPTDQLCEHHVRKVKDLCKSFHSQLEPSLVEKAVLAYNPSMIVKDHWIQCLDKPELLSGGGHRQEYLSTDEKHIVRDELRGLNMFSEDTSRNRVNFCIKIRRVWEDLTDENVDIFLQRNKVKFNSKKS